MEITNNIQVSGSAFSCNDRLKTNKTTISLKGGTREPTKPIKDHFEIDRLETVHSRFNSVARTIRIADENMGKIENYIDRMKTELQGIIKKYPPFPPGSEERVKRLKNIYNSTQVI